MATTPTFNPGEALAAGKLQQLAQYVTYAPTLQASVTNPTLGSSPGQVGYAWVTGQLVHVWAFVSFGASPSAGSGTYYMTLPPAFPIAAAWQGYPIGTCRLLDDSASSEAVGVVIVEPAALNRVILEVAGVGFVTHASPIPWAQSDVLFMSCTYLTNPY